MFVFTDAEREIRSPDCAIVLNEAGREVLVGLTEEETAVYMDYVRRYGLNKRLWTPARPDKAERATLLELHDKHGRRAWRPLNLEHVPAENPPSKISTPHLSAGRLQFELPADASLRRSRTSKVWCHESEPGCSNCGTPDRPSLTGESLLKTATRSAVKLRH